MSKIAFIVSGIEQSEESRIYQFRAATPAEVQAADVEELSVPGRFRFEQVLEPEWVLPGMSTYIELGIAIDPYGCVTIPTDTVTSIIEDDSNGTLPIFVTKQGEDAVFLGFLQLEDYNPEAGDPVPATKVGDMIILNVWIF